MRPGNVACPGETCPNRTSCSSRRSVLALGRRNTQGHTRDGVGPRSCVIDQHRLEGSPLMRGFSLQRPAGMVLLAALIFGLSVCASTASAISSSHQASVSPAGNETPFTPSADPTAPDASDGDSAVQDQGGGPEFCHLRSHIAQQTGKIMDAVGWFGDCYPDTSPLVYTLTAACVVETAGSWHEVSCTSIRSQFGGPPFTATTLAGTARPASTTGPVRTGYFRDSEHRYGPTPPTRSVVRSSVRRRLRASLSTDATKSLVRASFS